MIWINLEEHGEEGCEHATKRCLFHSHFVLWIQCPWICLVTLCPNYTRTILIKFCSFQMWIIHNDLKKVSITGISLTNLITNVYIIVYGGKGGRGEFLYHTTLCKRNRIRYWDVSLCDQRDFFGLKSVNSLLYLQCQKTRTRL